MEIPPETMDKALYDHFAWSLARAARMERERAEAPWDELYTHILGHRCRVQVRGRVAIVHLPDELCAEHGVPQPPYDSRYRPFSHPVIKVVTRRANDLEFGRRVRVYQVHAYGREWLDAEAGVM